MKNIFDKSVSNELIERINHLNANTPPQWGKMNVAQMLAHCNVAYELVYTNKHPKPNAFMRFVIKLFGKSVVTSDTAYKKNITTAPVFLVAKQQDFELEKQRLIDFINQTQSLGSEHFELKESHSFGKLTAKEWSNMFYKHLDHHLTQFGV
ncbi:MAG: DUF1569 domain-containing protein [Bacteroidetes bacterium]|nr:DUF1569 domain-containing protein [Bacteroidota bacterium]